MAQIKTSNFLPETFRTETNQKFLNATLDQLVTQPDLRNINGYVGRKFAPTFKSTDNYQPEPSTLRQNYQLEPSVVVKNKVTGEREFFSSYIDLLQQIQHSGGFTNNQDRLFNTESYSYDGLFDFDKFVNFNQYYWLENGPDTVLVTTAAVPLTETFTVTRDATTGSYKFSTTDGIENPKIQLAYGGTYKFVVNQPGYPFWIQSKAGTSESYGKAVLGVTNNGIDVGTVTFKVPLATAQDYYIRLPLAGSADLSTTLKYTQVQGKTLSSIIAAGENGIDGVNARNQLDLKSLIFIGDDLDNSYWTVNSQTVPVASRRNAWQISLSDDPDPIVTLDPLKQSFVVGAEQKVFVRGGLTRSELSYYLARDYLSLNKFNLMPNITAPLTTLYYQDGTTSSMVGQFQLLVADATNVDVDTDIIGAKGYKSPNGIKFTNGLKISFDSSITPTKYQNKTYYVEGVGKSIKLVDTALCVNPESFATNGIATKDYITINRGSIDLNPWSRSNRWFHIDVINTTAEYNNVTPIVNQSLRATRPIIEFESDIQLYNYGTVGVAPIDIIDFVITDSRNNVELMPYGITVNGVKLEQDMRVVFASDFDPTVRNKIYTVNIIYIQNLGTNVVNLVEATDGEIVTKNGVVVLNGSNKGKQYYYNGSWIEGQEKLSVNQSPLFDIFDNSGVSISTYTGSTFVGTKIFSYQLGTGVADSVLGFPLSYRNFNQIGDIQFDNNFSTDTFNYYDGSGTLHTNVNINWYGYLKQNTDLNTYNVRNIWTTNLEKTKQFQIISGIYDGLNSYFKIDITNSTESTVPYFKVYRNALLTTGWEIYTTGVTKYVHVTDPNLSKGDQIDILIYSKNTVSALGYYEVPKNLDNNSQNNDFSVLTLGQLRNHVATLVENSNQVTGDFPGNSNIRDLYIKAQGGSILQHASPVWLSSIFLTDENANFLKSLDLARREYSKLKNKIIELSTRTAGLDFKNIPVTLDTLLKNINAVKNKSFPWYYSDMVPYGDIKNVISYTVQSSELTDYEISNVFSDTTFSNTAVLIYLNGVQLVSGHDYVFDTQRSGVSITVPLTIGDVITINEYSNTDGCYIPETPTKLGLYPKFTPKKYYDTTYTTPIYVIQGHDGSITPAFGDYRDDLLLEFEKRIYNNIKVDQAKNSLDIYDYLPGKFRATEYSNSEFNQLLTNSFLSWVGSTRVDYITNTTFVASNEFTYNYGRFADVINGAKLPGYWRAIYKYFYDTDRPHTHPWEMIGLSEEPSWWETRYGTVPFTGGNMVLWDDMAAGLVWNNGNSYVDQRFVRSGLQNIIPVDANGSLLPPLQVLVKSFNSNDASADFKIGDQGPVETAWRRSSDFPFAFQQALALAKPAFYFGTLMNTNEYYKHDNLNQYIFDEYLQRISPLDIDINGVIDLDEAITDPTTAKINRSGGYLNWIADYLRSLGIDPNTRLNDLLKYSSIQLAYKMAGFTDQTLMQVIAEQSSPSSTNTGIVIPNESYAIELNKSTPVDTLTYSAVIIERTANGYTVSGYDSTAPYFTLIPSLANGRNYSIPVLQENAVIYQDYQKYKVTIPYGYEFTTRQQVVDFLVSYQRYLRGIGFLFTDVDPDLQTQRDWFLSVKEFMTWAQQGWNTSSVLVLSPVLNHVSVFTSSGVVDKIQNTPNDSCVLDTSYNYIKYSQMSVNRQNDANGNTFGITVNGGQTIALIKLSVVEYEHVMIFDNTDIFNDVIYVPELGNRQYRLKLVGKKTGSWTGAMNPPGFVYNSTVVDAWQQGKDYMMGSLVKYKNRNYTALQDIPAASTFDTNKWAQLSSAEIKTGLLPNFSYNAEKFNRFNDIDNPELLGDFHLYSDSAIGFQPRQYMTNFGLDETTQAKFYQGFIRQKGTMNAINAFTATGVNGASSTINVYEEWAMRVGEYGALDNNRSIDLILTEGTFDGDPVTFTLLPPNGTSTTTSIGVHPNQLYKTEGNYSPNIYTNRDSSSNYRNDIQTAGYVNLNDITTTVFDLNTSLSTLSANIDNYGIGATIWAAKDLTNNWNVFRVTETSVTATEISYSVDNIGVIKTKFQHGISYGDIVVLRNFDTRVNAFYRVYAVIDPYSFSVILEGQPADQIKLAGTITGTGALYKLQSVRVQYPTDLNTITPQHGWVDNDKLWVDSDPEVNGWAVYNKSTPWSGNVNIFNPNMKLDANSYASSVGFGTVTAISADGSFAAASSPSLNNGNVYAFVSNVTNNNTYTLVANIGQRSGGVKFGASLDIAGNLLYIGNPGDGVSSYGRVHVHRFDGVSAFPWTQTLSSPSLSNIGDLFGASISASEDKAWLYIGAPNAGNVYVYHTTGVGTYTYANTISIGSSSAAQFGYTVKTTSTGNQVAISAPYQAVGTVSSAGVVYVFDRSIETFIANGTTYHTTYPNGGISKVSVNGVAVTSGFTFTGTTLTFTTAPTTGSVITVETNYIQLLETLNSPIPTSGGAFGTVTWISGNDADVYVSSPGYSASGYYSGIVYRYANQGANYGSITGTTYSSVINLGDSIRINGINVAFKSGNTITAANDINSANITGVYAIAEDFGALTITSNIATPYQKLIIGPGLGNAVANLGLSVFSVEQTIQHPGTENVSQFGAQVQSSDDSKTLAIAATGGSSETITVFDTNTTTFDMSDSIFIDTIDGSGVVYIYGLVNNSLTGNIYDQYVLVQKLQNSSVSANDQFGYSIAMNGNTIIVGAPGDDNSTTIDSTTGLITSIPNAGTYYVYNNFSGNIGWDIVQQETAKVDIDSVSRLYLYNINTQVISATLDYIDPAKGKVLGAAQEDLDFITAYDPAVYNTVSGIESTPNLANSLDFSWGPEQVTKTWWNTGIMRYVDYEQGNLTYRANNWGKLFPGSQIQVCEWVASDMPPSAYNGLGTPLYPDNSAYVVKTTINPNTKLPKSTYYYWVYDKNSLEIGSAHVNTVSTIKDIIENPQAQGIPYATAIRDDSISLHGISNYISGNSTVLHLDYDTIRNTHVIHSEYQLVQEGNENSVPPIRIVDKLIDSLSGVDANGYAVPDSSLSPQNSIGLGVAPNQTLFVNRALALENWVDYTNSIIAQYPIVKEKIINGLYAADPLPDPVTYDIQVATRAELDYINTTNLTIGYTVLVKNDENYNNLWTTYAWGVSSWSSIPVTKQKYYTPSYWEFIDWYDSTYDNSVLPTYVVDTTANISALSLIAGETVRVNNNGNGEFAIYRVNQDGSVSTVGIQNGTIRLKNTIYSETTSSFEVRNILTTFKDYIWIDDLAQYYNSSFFFLINYILTEQPSVDWVFKTSFISILHKFKNLDQPASYSPDNQTYYEQYINEVKPYRTSIREYKLNYQSNDEYFGDTTDFDVPSTYIDSYGEYYSPNGSRSNDATLLSTLPQYSQWYNNYSYGISEVVVINPGSGYTFTPVVTVVGGGGTGAKVIALVDFASGTISKFEVQNPGYGYTSQPTIFINGAGTGAVGYAKLVNHYQIDSLPTTQLDTFNNVSVYVGNVITQQNTGAYGTVYTASTANILTLIDVVGTFNTSDYIYSDAANLKTNVTSTTSYTQFINSSYNTVRNLATTIAFDRVSYTNTITSWAPNITVPKTTKVVYDNRVYNALIDVYSSTVLTMSGNISASIGDFITQANTTANAKVIALSSNAQIITVGNLTANYVRRGGNILVNGIDSKIRPIIVNNIFDYTKYSAEVTTIPETQQWTANSNIAQNSFVNYQGRVYEALTNVYSSANLHLTGNIANISVNIDDYITQSNSLANAKVIAVYQYANTITVANLTTNFIYGNVVETLYGNIAINGTTSNVKPRIVENIFDTSKYITVSSTKLENAADRITAYYEPTTGMPGRELAQLMSGIEYPGVSVQGVKFDANSSVFTSNSIYSWANTYTIYSSNVSIPSVHLTISASNIVYTGNIITQQTTGATGTVYETSTGTTITLVDVVGTFDTTHSYLLDVDGSSLGIFPVSSTSFTQVTQQNLVDFTTLGYSVNQPLTIVNADTNESHTLEIVGLDTWKIQVTGNVPNINGANISLKYYDFNNPTYLDSEIYSHFTGDPDWTTMIDGGAYYDTYSSHAPEELVPGITLDNLNMTVTTGLQNNTAFATYRIVHNMNTDVASGDIKKWPKYYGVSPSHQTTLTANLHITDSNIYVANASAITAPDLHMRIPGTVFINGEKIVFWQIDTINNVLMQIRRAVDGTGAPSLHVSGSQVVDVNSAFLIPGGNVVHTTTWLNQAVGSPKSMVDNLGEEIADNFGSILTTTGSAGDAVTDGLGLEGSSTDQALFIKNLS